MLDHGPGDIRFFDRVAPLYDRLMPAADEAALSEALSLSRRSVRTLLDVAGGTGRAARALSGLVDDEPAAPGVVVVDQSLSMLAAARRRGLAALGADATALPVRTDAVDAVVVTDALHHVRDQRALVAEARRVVAPGGVVVVADFDPATLRGRALVALERLVGFDSTFSTPDDLARFFEREGLSARVVTSGFGYVVAGRVPES
ncbi:class I SAM-dependent methyltransferase [Salinigranum halophilum]|uniref:class I SAM-dependent methyltransferase n=1 Tax=Salinigranum halophilum TaxID=2565931 RepID=UPI0010A9033C|nr:methyltransferase domain-containing protein [Salinigranum halophilum]